MRNLGRIHWWGTRAGLSVVILTLVCAGSALARSRSLLAGTYHTGGSLAEFVPHLRGSSLSVAPAIVGGTAAVQGQLPFMAFVEYSDSSGYVLCSGTVVSPNVVLTAGHCAVDRNTGIMRDAAGFTVVTSSVDWTDASNRQVSAVSSVIPDPAYDESTHNYDAALLVLSTPTTAPSISLPTSADQYLEIGGTGAGIAGWGETYSGSAPPTHLRWANATVQNPGYCGHFSPYYDSVSSLCTVEPPAYSSGTCSGDSGGPLFAQDASGQTVQLGITSYILGRCRTNAADYYTAVLPLVDWINQVIGTTGPSPPSSTPPPPAPTLPRLAISDARRDVSKTLDGILRRTFSHAHAYRTSCYRDSSVKVGCGISFWSGANDYGGTVTIHYLFGSDGRVYWSDSYVLRWVDDECYFHSGHPKRCQVSLKRGSW